MVSDNLRKKTDVVCLIFKNVQEQQVLGEELKSLPKGAEQQVLGEELKSLPKGAKVYKQQQNSQIFFRTSRDKAFDECKRTLDSLVQEYKEVDAVPEQVNAGNG